jgi:CRISPR-associated protein Cas2
VYVILVYDISEEKNGAKRQRRVFKICKKYLIHIQNSVFEGDLNPSHLEKMKQELMPWIDKTLDSVIVFKSREERWLAKEFYGKDESDVTSNFL